MKHPSDCFLYTEFLQLVEESLCKLCTPVSMEKSAFYPFLSLVPERKQLLYIRYISIPIRIEGIFKVSAT